MEIILDDSALSFVSLGRGTMHIKIGAYRRAACGRLIPWGTEPQVSRQFDDTLVCERCSNRSVRQGKAHKETEVHCA